AEGDCYLCMPPDLGIEAAALDASESVALGAGESALSGTASAAALHTFTLDSGASRCFFRDSTTFTPLSAPVAVSLADPSGGPILARSSTVLPCRAVPSGSMSGLHLPSFSTNLVSNAVLQDQRVDTFTWHGLTGDIPLLDRLDTPCIAPPGCPLSERKAADQDMAVVRTTREKLPQLLMHLSVRARDNNDKRALSIPMLPRETYGNGRVAGRKVLKDRLTVGFLVNADGLHSFRPLVFAHFIEQLNVAMYAEDHLFGFRTRKLSNVRIVYLPPNTTAFTQPLDQGIIATAKVRYRAHWLSAFKALWSADGATSAMARYKPNFRHVLAWLCDAWMNIERRTIQRCWWRTECLPRVWAMELEHVGNGGNSVNCVNGTANTRLEEAVGDVGILIDRLGLGSVAMPAGDFVRIDDNQPTCAEPGQDPLVTELPSAPVAETWEAPASMQAAYDDSNPATREARSYARAASEMLIGYARATGITPCDLCALFDIRNPIIRGRMERTSPALNLYSTPPPAMPLGATPPAETPRRRGRVLLAWMTQPTPDWVTLAQQAARRQELIDAWAPAVMGGYLDAAEWMRL
ncbi:unnamed protein product, partial [Closterium sp. NIES-54]